MSTQNPAQPSGDYIPFSEDEIASFAEPEPIEGKPAGPPESTGAGDVNITSADLMGTIQQQNATTNREISELRRRLEEKETPSNPPEITQEVPGTIPVKFDKDNKAIVTRDDLASIVDHQVKQQLGAYHKENIEPFVPTVQSVQKTQAVESAIRTIRQIDPKMLEGRDETRAGQLAIDLFNSPFNTGVDSATKTEWALNEIKSIMPSAADVPGATNTSLPLSTGTGTSEPVHNQTGRTPAGTEGLNSVYPYEQGQTVKLKSKAINDFDSMDDYNSYVAWVEGLYQTNQTQGMRWKIVMED